MPSRPNDTAEVQRLIEASSLGTPDAVAMRNRTRPELARAIVARSRQVGQRCPCGAGWPGYVGHDSTCGGAAPPCPRCLEPMYAEEPSARALPEWGCARCGVSVPRRRPEVPDAH